MMEIRYVTNEESRKLVNDRKGLLQQPPQCYNQLGNGLLGVADGVVYVVKDDRGL